MELCSPKVWIYDSSDEEYISASEMLEGISPSGACMRTRRTGFGNGQSVSKQLPHLQPRPKCPVPPPLEDEIPQLLCAEDQKPPLLTQPIMEPVYEGSLTKYEGYIPETPQEQIRREPPAEPLPLKTTRKKRKKPIRKRNGGNSVRQADTNILSMKFKTLAECNSVHTGDAVVCKNTECSAVLSHLSNLTNVLDEKMWVCEFCGTSNMVEVVAEELPTEEATTYMIAPAPTTATQALKGSGIIDSVVVFCIDTSGSMGVTTEIPGNFKLKGHERVRTLSASLNTEGEDQSLPQQRKNVTHVSRLQAVQAAVDHQITTLFRAHPSYRVALIAFGDEVTVIGDGNGEALTVAGDRLRDMDELVKIGTEIPLPSAVKHTRDNLSKKVFELEEDGQTALGPAMVISILLAARSSGSQVIVCTDGLANKGVGNLDGLRTPEAYVNAKAFYDDLGNLAHQNGVTVSLVTIKGTDCRLLELGQVVSKTAGEVNIVDQMKITKEFNNILANPIIATRVISKVVLHSGLYVRVQGSAVKESVHTVEMGSVTAISELTFEYGVRRKESVERKGVTPATVNIPSVLLEGRPHLPFQLQIEHTRPDGSRCMKVITRAVPSTTDRAAAEKDANIQMVGRHVARATAKQAINAHYSDARKTAITAHKLMERVSDQDPQKWEQFISASKDVIALENQLRDKQRTESSRVATKDDDIYISHCEDASHLRKAVEGHAPTLTPRLWTSPSSGIIMSRRQVERQQNMDDDEANFMHTTCSPTTPKGY